MIRLLVIEDHPVAVSGLKNMFRAGRDGIEVALYATSVESAVLSTGDERFDLILLDLYLGNTDPIDNVKMLGSVFSSKPVVVFTSEESEAWQRKMFNHGVRAYILKSAARKEIAEIIRNVFAGRKVFPAFIGARDIQPETPNPEKNPVALTASQRSILAELARGKSYREIAASLGTSVSNIEKTTMRMRNKSGAKTNVELLALLYNRNQL